MNTFCGLRPGSLLDELNFINKLTLDKKNENEIWNKFCVNCEAGDEKDNSDVPKKFSSHPKRLCSETDASVASSRRTSLSSKSSVLNVDLKDINYAFQENKTKIQNARKKLHMNETQSRLNDSYQLELGMGDGCSMITPRNGPDKIITYYDRVEKFAQEEASKYKKKSLSSITSKRAVPVSVQNCHRNIQKSPPAQNSYRNIVSDSLFEKKFKLFVEKSLHTVSDIRSILETGINPPDGEEDESRRIIRVKEFSNRFSRNYLYPLARQLEELTEMESRNLNLNHKLLYAYQVVLNGLQAYHSHLPTSIGSCSSDRLKSLLKHLLQLCDIHNKFVKQPDENVDSDFINTFKLNAELTLKKIDDHFSAKSTDSVLKSKSTKVSFKQNGTSKMGAVKSRKNSMETRLSMYNIPAGNFRNDHYWRVMQSWAKKRPNVKSRYKTAAYRHRPPIEKKQSQSLLPGKFRPPLNKSSTVLRRTPLTTPINDDHITTLVQMEDSKDKRYGVCTEDEARTSAEPPAVADHEGIVLKLLQLVLDNNRRTSTDNEGEQKGKGDAALHGDDAKIADVLERLKADGDVEILRKVLAAVQQGGGDKGEADEQLKLQIVKSQSSVLEEAVKRRKEPKITVTGEKNAKLICIIDENSIIESDDEIKSEDKDCSTEKQVLLKPVSSTETQTDITSNKKNKSTQKATKTDSLKMKRLPKSSKSLQKLPKDYAVSIIQYKLDFHRHCKQNPMYRKTTDIQPWVLMAKMSDEVLDSALLGVVQEIELNDIVQQIYDSELQL